MYVPLPGSRSAPAIVQVLALKVRKSISLHEAKAQSRQGMVMGKVILVSQSGLNFSSDYLQDSFILYI